MIIFLLGITLRALQILIFARVVISFVPAWQRTSWGAMIVLLSEPILAPFRGLTARAGGVALDFSPMIALLVILVVSRMLH